MSSRLHPATNVPHQKSFLSSPRFEPVSRGPDQGEALTDRGEHKTRDLGCKRGYKTRYRQHIKLATRGSMLPSPLDPGSIHCNTDIMYSMITFTTATQDFDRRNSQCNHIQYFTLPAISATYGYWNIIIPIITFGYK